MMKLSAEQLQAANYASHTSEARALAAEIVRLAGALSHSQCAPVIGLALALYPGKGVKSGLQSLRNALLDAQRLAQDFPRLQAEATAELAPAVEAANKRIAQIGEELARLERNLAQKCAEIDRPLTEWRRWQQSGLTRSEILANGGVEPSTHDEWHFKDLKSQAQIASDVEAKALVAEREALTRFKYAPDPRSIPALLKKHWRPKEKMAQMLGGLGQ